ncbi:MAG: hypothetical protein JJU42_07115 [Rhodobacteraceae bacterium]|nr:hypothetical protein [Paracoccaceae bacterium]
MGAVTALSASGVSLADIRARVSEAARACAYVPNRAAILIDPVSVAGHDLASLMMGMGVDVLRGPQVPCVEYPPLLLVGAADLGRSATRRRLALSRALHPDSVICAVTGSLTETAGAASGPDAQHDDARACLLAAGIGFISTTEVNHAGET